MLESKGTPICSVSMSKKKGNMEDRISLLPDSLVHHILSFLHTKQAVQTCVLSKRWKTIWTDMPTINFDFDSYQFKESRRNPDSKETSFKHFVLGVLSQRCGGNIQKLSHSSSRENYKDNFFVEFLIYYAKYHMVRELCIDIPNIVYFDWQCCLSACNLITVLKISCGFVDDWGSLMLPSLRTLEIKSVWENQHESKGFKEKMFSGCPNLESLVLDNYLCESFCICAPKLENLELRSSHMELHFLELELLTPNLKCVKFMNISAAVKSASDFPYLDKVNLEVEDYDLTHKLKLTGYVINFLQAFCNARSLTLSFDVLKVLLSFSSLKGRLLFHNLKHLKLKANGTNKTIGLPISLLPCSSFSTNFGGRSSSGVITEQFMGWSC